MEEKNPTLKDLEATLIFLERTKNGEYAKIETSSLKYVRAYIEEQYINTDDKEYYLSFDS